MVMVASDAQKRARQKWASQHQDKLLIYRYRSYARKYVREIATDGDLQELIELIKKRKEKYTAGKC